MYSLIYVRIRRMSDSVIYVKYAIIILANLVKGGAVIGFIRLRGGATPE
jgi:hypothetical protein